MTNDLQQARIEAIEAVMLEALEHEFETPGEAFGWEKWLREMSVKALAAADAHLPSVEQIAEVLERKLGHAHRDAPYADLTEEAVAVRALFGEVA